MRCEWREAFGLAVVCTASAVLVIAACEAWATCTVDAPAAPAAHNAATATTNPNVDCFM
jgi:hypothetical protein